MSRRLIGNPGVDALGIAREKKKKPKRTPSFQVVLGAEVMAMLSEMSEAKRTTRAEVLRTLIVKAYADRKARALASPGEGERAGFGSAPEDFT